MLLSAVASHFDDIPITDGYTGAFLFMAQVSSFNETSPDGSTNKKRTISVRPGSPMPARRLLKYFGEAWLIGDGNTDGLQGQKIRTAYWIRKVIDTVVSMTPAQACNDVGGVSMGSSKEYLKDTVNSTTDSEYDPQWDFTLAANESVVKGYYLKAGGKLYRVRSAHTTASGFLVANSDELDGIARIPVILKSLSGGFDPVTETQTTLTLNTFGIFFEPTKLFRFQSQADPRILSGDMTLVLPIQAAVGDLVTLAGVDWRVQTATPELDGWNLHIRRS